MATPLKHSPVRPAVWTTWAPSVGILCVVGAHILAAALGLYGSAPSVTWPHAPGGGGQVEMAVQSHEGPTGAEGRHVESPLDSARGTWVPLAFERESRTYRGRYELSAVSGGNHALYLRTSDTAGTVRSVSVTVTVNPEEPSVANAEPRPLADEGTPQG